MLSRFGQKSSSFKRTTRRPRLPGGADLFCDYCSLAGFLHYNSNICQETPTIRVLLAEDFEPYRTLTASLLKGNSGLQVSEASDGLEAIEKAKQLRPDLIFMDIGLPKLNGIEAARRILGLNPSAKIVFLTQETDIDVVRGAFSLGACGYVLKQQAETDLLPALAAVLQGRRFVSSRLSDNGQDGQREPRF